MAVELIRCTFDPTLVKPKCVWEAVDFIQFLKICLQFSAVCLQFFKNIYRLSNGFWLYQHRVKSGPIISNSDGSGLPEPNTWKFWKFLNLKKKSKLKDIKYWRLPNLKHFLAQNLNIRRILIFSDTKRIAIISQSLNSTLWCIEVCQLIYKIVYDIFVSSTVAQYYWSQLWKNFSRVNSKNGVLKMQKGIRIQKCVNFVIMS